MYGKGLFENSITQKGIVSEEALYYEYEGPASRILLSCVMNIKGVIF